MKKCPKCGGQTFTEYDIRFLIWEEHCCQCGYVTYPIVEHDYSGDAEIEEHDDDETQCFRCKEWWPATTEYFQKCSTAPDGMDRYCKACRQEIRRGQYVKKVPGAESRSMHQVESLR